MHRLAAIVYREEGIRGFFRGVLVPLSTISFVRMSSLFTLLSSISRPLVGAASFTIYNRSKEFFRDRNILNHESFIDAGLVGGVGGALAGALISFGSARKWLSLCTSCLTYVLKHLNWSRSDANWSIASLLPRELTSSSLRVHWKQSKKS